VTLAVLIYWLCPAEGIESEPSIREYNSKSSAILMKRNNCCEELTKTVVKRTKMKVEIQKGMS